MAKKRKGCMLAYPFEAKRLQGYPKPYIVQPKLDGDRCRILIKGGFASLLSSTEELITGVPHINAFFDFIAERNPTLEVELDGELYCHGMDQGKINGIVSRKYADTLHPEYEKIKFNMFDVVEGGAQAHRLASVSNWCATFRGVELIEEVPFTMCDSYDEVIDCYNKCLRDGFEGIIVRDLTAPYLRRRSTQMMKFKEKKKDYYKIVRVIEAVSENGTPLGMVGSFECEDTTGSTFRVGAGRLSHEKRRHYWEVRETIPGQWCKVGYQNLTAKRKVPRSGLCIEVSVTMENPEET